MTSTELAFGLPNAPHSRIHIHLTEHDHALVLFVTNSGEGSGGPCGLGSFVYAMPNVSQPPPFGKKCRST
jgi:hypothetical protein